MDTEYFFPVFSDVFLPFGQSPLGKCHHKGIPAYRAFLLVSSCRIERLHDGL